MLFYWCTNSDSRKCTDWVTLWCGFSFVYVKTGIRLLSYESSAMAMKVLSDCYCLLCRVFRVSLYGDKLWLITWLPSRTIDLNITFVLVRNINLLSLIFCSERERISSLIWEGAWHLVIVLWLISFENSGITSLTWRFNLVNWCFGVSTLFFRLD